VEEGTLENHEVTFKIRYHTAHQLLAKNVPVAEFTSRTIKLSGEQLSETVTKQGQGGVKSSYTKYFTRTAKYVPY
jgi:hypothetical protein